MKEMPIISKAFVAGYFIRSSFVSLDKTMEEPIPSPCEPGFFLY
jgi:hypothetical protein